MTLTINGKTMHSSKFACLTGLVVLAAVSSTGCSTWRESAPVKLAKKLDVPSGVPWMNREPRAGVPRRMVVTWVDAVRQQPGVPSERGFGGKVFFYDRDEKETIKVDGQLVVYAFDEKDRLPTDNRPTKRYVFPPEVFENHANDSPLGLSYNVWLPWDASGGETTNVSLIARFEPVKGGNLIVSEQTRQKLPGMMQGADSAIAGTVREETITTVSAFNTGDAAVQTAGYQSAGSAATTNSSDNGLQTTTIKMPSKNRR